MSLSALRDRWSWDGNAFSVKKAGVVLAAGKPGTVGFLYHRYHFYHDDFLELALDLRLEGGAPAGASRAANAFVVQLAPLQTRYDSREDPASMVFSGLTVMLLGPDPASGAYFATHRYFRKETLLRQEYLDLLADRRESLAGCELPRLDDVTAMVLQLDFEGANRMEVLFEAGGRRFSCFVVEGQMQYVAARGFYASFKARAALEGFGVTLLGVAAREKTHSLDVEEELQVSHGLVGEVFDKLAAFTRRLNADAGALRDIAELQTAALRKTDQLELYARDLFFGTKRFQEFIIETLSEHRVFAPDNLPKMEMIRNKVEQLDARQQEFADLFAALRGLLATKKLLARTQKQLRGVQAQMEDLSRVVGSDEFAALVERSQQMMAPLRNLTFSTMLGSIVNFSPPKARSARLLALNIFLAAGTVALLSVFGLLILRKVGSFEVSQLS